MKDGEKSFFKIFEIIELIASSRNGLKGKEISLKTKIPLSTVFRMLKFLVERGYLVNQEQMYCLGTAMSRLGSIASKQNPLIKIAHPILMELSEQTLETVHLGKLQNTQIVYVDKVEGERSVRMGSMIGKTSPLHCTGVGKTILAFLSGEKQDDIISSVDFTSFTPQTIQNRESLKKELAKIKKQGYAVDNCEHELGVYCVAAPVLDADGVPVCAISISGSELYLREHTAEYAMLLRKASMRISEKL